MEYELEGIIKADGFYDDIIKMPHHVSRRHQQMSMEARAAQFAPFAALTGYDDAVVETARLTSSKRMLDDDDMMALDAKMQRLIALEREHPKVTITFFQPDSHKQGGEYRTLVGEIKNIDLIEGKLHLIGNQTITIADIMDMDAEVFQRMHE